jgi:hypothetical protein
LFDLAFGTTKGGTTMIRRFLVFDGDGELVATFPEWETAHSWAHLRSVEPLTPQPVQLEDRQKRQTWTVEGGRCRTTIWRRHVEYGHCDSTESDRTLAPTAAAASPANAPAAAAVAAGAGDGEGLSVEREPAWAC